MLEDIILTNEEKINKYKDDPNFILQNMDGDIVVTPKFTDEDWKKVEDMIDTHPLFCKNFSDVENSPMLQALQSIKYDETAEIILEKLYVHFA